MPQFDFPDLSDALFKKLSGLLFEESGITLKDYKKYLVLNRLSKFVGPDRPYKNFEDYYQALLNDKTRNLMIDFVNALTTNFSYFFRDDIHFDLLRQYLSENAGKETYLRFWSAACSTGEEPYSMVIACYQTLGELYGLDLKILATDLSTKVLEIAKQGSYHYSKIRGHISDAELRNYFNFNKGENTFTIKSKFKEYIAFRYLNLQEPYPFQKLFDVVFLRNVLIYFGKEEKEFVVNQIYDFIKPGGYLVLGLSETLVEVKHPYTAFKNSIYQKKK